MRADHDTKLIEIPRLEWDKELSMKCSKITRSGYFMNAQNMRIRWFSWDAFPEQNGEREDVTSKKKTKKKTNKKKEEEEEEEEEAIVVGAHGNGAHSMFEWLQSSPEGSKRNKYENSWIEKMNRKGFTFYAFDHQGHGRSDFARKTKAYFESANDLVSDCALMMKLVRERHGKKKVFGCGVSMGGFVVARASIEYPKLFSDGVILLCPALSLKRLRQHGANRFLFWLLRFLSIVMPTMEVGATRKNLKFPFAQKEMEEDPLCWPSGVRGPRARIGSELYFGTVKFNRPGYIERFKHPVIAFHSTEDPMTDFAGTKEFIERCSSDDKTLVACSSVFHHDLQHVRGHSDSIGDRICDWISLQSEKKCFT